MTMKKWIILVISLMAVGIGIFGYFYNPYYHKNISRHPKMLCYETLSGSKNPVLVIDYLRQRKDYEAYYNCERQKEGEYYIGIPLQTLPVNDTVFVMGYSKDSMLADVVSYSRINGYRRVWVFKEFLHEP